MSKTPAQWRPLVFCLCLAAPVMLGGADEASPVARAFGSTIVSTYPDGRTGELWLDSNGSYTARGRRGDPSSGHWKVNDNKLCLNQSRPWSPPFGFCTPLPTGGLDHAWSARAVTGETIQVRLVKGHFEGKAAQPTGYGDDGTPPSASQQN